MKCMKTFLKAARGAFEDLRNQYQDLRDIRDLEKRKSIAEKGFIMLPTSSGDVVVPASREETGRVIAECDGFIGRIRQKYTP